MKFFNSKKENKGMTFVELIVVIGIFAAISGTVLFNYRDFSNGIKLQNLSQEVALQAKRAQTLASQGRRPVLSNAQSTNGLDNFLPFDWVSSYGVAFDTDYQDRFIFYFNSPYYYIETMTEGSPDDLNASRSLDFYDFAESNYLVGCGAQTSECLEELLITDGSRIDLICSGSEPVGQNADPECSQGVVLQTLHVSYTRPFLESYILGDDGSGLFETPYAFIKLTSSDGGQSRYVTFWNTGQVSVN